MTMQSPTLDFLTLQDDEIRTVLSRYSIGLTIDEAKTVQKLLKRPPTITEAVIWGIQGSEHCSYKSSRRFLKTLPTDGSHVILGPKEDSGIVAITDVPPGKRWGLVISHESHNHPSQIVPYEGAATGIGGCVRDVLCMGARVIGCLDALRLGDLKSEETQSIAKEVARGIAGYANPLGIPNLGGDTVFDASYNRNCLVNAITVGIVREDEIIHSYVPQEAGEIGYDIILIGKATDRSGFGGAAFASQTMEEEKSEQNTGAVQEPNPFLERHLLASTYDLFDKLAAKNELHRVSFKDLGAGGVVCASVEQVAPRNFGAQIDLEKVHTSLPGLPPEVIGCAETQERFCWMCHPDLTAMILDHYNKAWDLPSVAEHARASVIGKVTTNPLYELTYKGTVVCSALSTDITSGLQYTRPTKDPKKTFREPVITCTKDCITANGKTISIRDVFQAMISHPSHGSKSSIVDHYDKSVMGNTVLEPGEGDAGVIMPLQDLASYVHRGAHPDWDLPEEQKHTGVALSAGGNGRYGRISPYLQGMNAVWETVRNIAAVGAVPRALTDCLNYGNPERPEELWELEEGVRGIADAARGIYIENEPIPIISGNVSLYNTTPSGAIDPTAIVCAAGVMPDARKARSMQLTQSGHDLYLLGSIKDECGGSAYYDLLESLTHATPNTLLGANVPHPDLKEAAAMITFLYQAIQHDLVAACHDISEGGLLLALFEMTLPKRGIDVKLGVDVSLDVLQSELRSDTLLFSETGTFCVSADSAHRKKLAELARNYGCTLTKIGAVTESPVLRIVRDGTTLIETSLQEARTLRENALQKMQA